MENDRKRRKLSAGAAAATMLETPGGAAVLGAGLLGGYVYNRLHGQSGLHGFYGQSGSQETGSMHGLSGSSVRQCQLGRRYTGPCSTISRPPSRVSGTSSGTPSGTPSSTPSGRNPVINNHLVARARTPPNFTYVRSFKKHEGQTHSDSFGNVPADEYVAEYVCNGLKLYLDETTGAPLYRRHQYVRNAGGSMTEVGTPTWEEITGGHFV